MIGLDVMARSGDEDGAAPRRAERRREVMRRAQAIALDAFEARGFERVSIEEIARATDVGPATIYRHFGTKERLVLWDPYEPALFERLAARLAEPGVEVGAAMLEALGETLATFYQTDRERILRRTRLTRATPSLAQAAAADLVALRGAIAAILRQTKRAKDELEARVVAGALVAALEAAADHWLDLDGRLSLERCLRMAFARLARLG